ncbi:hypothetical protein ACHQM5_023282 [Ranunculus cassubicifolius]
MGEKGGDKKADGGKKEEVKKEEPKKAEEGSNTIVLKIDMHCEGCVKKIAKSVKKFEGVESVQGDSATNKLTVKGKVSPGTLREWLENKTKKKVDILSPLPGKPAEAKKEGGGDGDKKKAEEKKPEEKKKEEKKEPSESTVLLKIRLHCEGCTVRIKKIIKKYKGVSKVDIDTPKDLVTVKGTMDVKALLPYLKEKLKRGVEVVPPKKEGEKKADGGEKKVEGGEKKAEGGEKKVEEKAKGVDGGEKKAETKVEVNKMEHFAYGNGYGYPYGYGNGNVYPVQYGNVHENVYPVQYGNVHENVYPVQYGNGNGNGNGNGYPVQYGNGSVHPVQYGNENMYPVQYPVHAPQMFSDENPNGCSIM